MDYTTYVFVSIILMLLIYTGLRLSNAIYGNFKAASQLRRQYAQRINLLPMAKKLQLRNIDVDEVLHSLPVAEIEKGIRGCESCNKNDECQASLKQKNKDYVAWCANDEIFRGANQAS